jgi:hypothetical protein
MTTVSEPGQPDEPVVPRGLVDKEGVDGSITTEDVTGLARSVDRIAEDLPGLLVSPPEPEPLSWRGHLRAALLTRPAVTVLTAALAVPGVYALILGAGASQAFTNLVGARGAQLIAHSLGTALLVGAALGIIGLARDDRFIELMGLVLIIAGAALYVGGVLLGLGAKGGMAALFAGCIAAALTARTVLVLSQIPHKKKPGRAADGG